ncbi:MAG: aldehyde dehydrogenase family protein, partial [Alphaproteobacteria bacterium]
MPPSERIDVTNPFDQKLVCTLNCDDERAIDWKLGRAQAAFERWRKLPLAERVERVAACVDRFADGGEDAARSVSIQMGKPIEQARREVETFVARARWALGAAEDALAPEVLLAEDAIDRRIEHHPKGVVLDVAAWNYPLLVPVNVIVPALIAGNTVVLKHSERTPLTGQAIARAFRDPDVPDLLTDVVVPPAQVERLVRDPRVAHVAFTGSVATGRRVVEEASGGFASV